MKVVELLTEARLELRQRVAKRLAAELQEMAAVYGKEFAEMSVNYDKEFAEIEDTPVKNMGMPWKVQIDHNHGRGVVIDVERNPNISESMWEGSVEGIKEFLEEDGYSGGLLPVDIRIAIETHSLLRLVVD